MRIEPMKVATKEKTCPKID